MYKTPLYLAAEKGINDIFQSLISHPTIDVNSMIISFIIFHKISILIVLLYLN